MSERPTSVIIIPTYNEAGNIGNMIDRLTSDIFPLLPGWNMKILVVDGNSTDGTRDAVKEKADVYLYVENKKEGIGAAYLKGFSYALDRLGADVVIEFDGDFQHPPETIPILLKEIENGSDYVVGARVHTGGFKSFRHFLTRFGGWVARFILFFPGKYFFIVSDPTTGLKATRVKGFEHVLLKGPARLYSRGFGYKVQLLSEMLNAGARYKEIPLDFQDRRAGKSKFVIGTIGEVLVSCVRSRFDRTRGK